MPGRTNSSVQANRNTFFNGYSFLPKESQFCGFLSPDNSPGTLIISHMTKID